MRALRCIDQHPVTFAYTLVVALAAWSAWILEAMT